MTAPFRPLSELATIQTGIPFLASSDVDGGESVFMPSALRGDGELLPDVSMVQPAKLLTSPEDKYRLRSEDILITAKATPGNIRCGYLSAEWEPRWLFAANLIRIHARSGKIHPRFLHAWFCHPDGRAALVGSSQSTTGQLNLTASSLADVMIPVPPWQDQMKIVELLEIASIAHHHAIAAAETRLTLAREIAFSPMKSPSPRILIQIPHPTGQLLITEDIDGASMPNNSLWEDVRSALNALPIRQLATLLDANSMETLYLNRSELAVSLARELRNFLAVCASDSNETIQIIGKDPTIDLDFFIANKLGLIPGKQPVSQLLLALDYLPPEAGQQVQIHLD